MFLPQGRDRGKAITYSEEYFDTIDPAELLELVKSGTLPPGDLTFAAESLGRRTSAELAVPVLLPLLQSESPMVREGAVLGLDVHVEAVEEVKLALLTALKKEDVWGVQQAIKEVLYGFIEDDGLHSVLFGEDERREFDND